MVRTFEITKKTFINLTIFATIISVILFIFGYFYFDKQKEKHIENQKKELKGITEASANLLSEWYEEIAMNSKLIFENIDFNNKLTNFIITKSPKDKDLLLKKLLESRITKFEDIYLYDFHSDTLLSTNKFTENFKLNQTLKSQLLPNKVFSTGFYYCKECDRFHLDLIVPKIINKLTYFIVFRIDVPHHILRTFQFKESKYISLDVNLAIKDDDSIRLITQPKFAKEKVVFHQEDTNHGLVLAFRGYTGFIEKLNFKNDKVVGFVTPIPKTNLAISTEVNIDDIYKEFTAEVINLIVILLFFIILVTALLSFFYTTRQKQLYQNLWLSEQEYSITLSSIGDAVITTDTEGRVTFLNPVAEKLTGWKNSEAINKNVEDVFVIVNEISREKVISPVDIVLKEGIIVGLANHTLLISKDGTETPIADSGAPIKDKSGNIKGVVLVFRDQTEERQHRNLLEQSVSRLVRAEEVSKTGNWEFHLNDKKMWGSQGAMRIYEIDENPIDYEIVRKVPLSEYREMMEIAKQNLIQKGEEYNIEFKIKGQKSGIIKDIHSIAKYDKEKNIIFGVIQDITERKKFLEKLKESTKNFKLLFENSPLGVYIADKDGNIIDANQTLIAMLGSPSLEATKQINVLTFPPLVNNGYAKYFVDARDNNKTIFLEMEYTTKWGKYLFLSSYIVPLADESGNVKVIYTISEDITERKNAENELIIAKNRAEESDLLKSAFLANMSHEIRTPMNAIIGFSKFLEDDDLDKAERDEYLKIINQKGADLLQLIDDILDLSKIEANQLVLFHTTSEVYPVIFEVVNSFNKTFKLQEYKYDKKIDVVIGQTNPEKIECRTDFNRLKQILNNLISNAMKFTDKGYVEVGYQLLDDKIEFYVKDTGIGIAPENFDKIFQRFRQGDDYYQSRKYGGTGLGLAIVRGLVEALGGRIWVESELGVGSTFRFTIDYIPSAELIDTRPDVISQRKLGTTDILIKVLIVEDDYTNYQLLKTTLNKICNCSILYAQDGQEALDIYNSNTDIDVIFMDIGMPVMNGIEAFRHLKEMKFEGKIIAVTAYVMTEEKEKIKSVGFDGYISKPYTINDIVNIMNDLNNVN